MALSPNPIRVSRRALFVCDKIPNSHLPPEIIRLQSASDSQIDNVRSLVNSFDIQSFLYSLFVSVQACRASLSLADLRALINAALKGQSNTSSFAFEVH